MKGIFTILAFICFYYAVGQNTSVSVNAVFPDWYQVYLDKQEIAAQKDITIYNSRMVASRSWFGPSRYNMYTNGTSFSWINIDSVQFTYSGNSKRNDYDRAIVLKLISGVWQPFQLKDKRYDGSGKVTTYTEQLYVNNVLQNKNRIQYTYNNNGQVLEELRLVWRNNAWADSSRLVNVYDSQNRLLKQTAELKPSSAWLFSYEYRYEYYKNTEMLTSESTTYISSSGNTMTEQQLYSYNEAGKMDSMMEGYLRQGVLEPTGRRYFVYNNQGLLWFMTTESYQNDRWRYDSKNTFTYDARNLLIEKQTAHYYDDTWVVIRATYYENNKMGLLEEYISYYYNIWFSDTLELESREAFSYDQAGNLLHHGEYTWLINNWDVKKDEYYKYNGYNQLIQDSIRYGGSFTYRYFNPRLNHYYYEEYEEGVWKEGAKIPSTVFPTPSRDNVTINMESLIIGKHVFKVFDYLGKQILEREYYWSKGDQQILIDASNWAIGCYIYKIESSYGYAEGKLIVQ